MHFLARHPGRSRSGLCVTGLLLALTLGSATALADWPTYGTLLGTAGHPTYIGWFAGARVFPNSDGGGTVGYFGRFYGNQSYPLLRFRRVFGDGTPTAYGGERKVGPDAAPAQLELLDISGRRVAVREVGSLGPGRHVVALAPEGSLPAGAYLLRLSQHGNQRVARVVVLK